VPLTAVVFAGGDPPGAAAASHIPDGAFVVAADSGLDHARALGVAVDVVIGDFDSVSSAALDEARRGDATVREFPTDKDATDLALALTAAAAQGPDRLLVVGGGGGRFDHLFGNLLLVSAPRLQFIESVDLYAGDVRVHVVSEARRTLPATVGELCSLLPMHGEAFGVTTTGLRWTLEGDDLEAGSSRGISNETTATEVTVAVAEGIVAVVFPGESP
jgi:thiamine pyrophosphokinase